MKQHKTLVNEALKKYPYLKCLKPYAYYPWEWIKEKDGVLYKELTDGKEKSLDNLLALVKEYSKINYCKYQFQYWPDVDGYTYGECVAGDVYGHALFSTLGEEIQPRLRQDVERLLEYEKTNDPALLVDNCFC